MRRARCPPRWPIQTGSPDFCASADYLNGALASRPQRPSRARPQRARHYTASPASSTRTPRARPTRTVPATVRRGGRSQPHRSIKVTRRDTWPRARRPRRGDADPCGRAIGGHKQDIRKPVALSPRATRPDALPSQPGRDNAACDNIDPSCNATHSSPRCDAAHSSPRCDVRRSRRLLRHARGARCTSHGRLTPSYTSIARTRCASSPRRARPSPSHCRRSSGRVASAAGISHSRTTPPPTPWPTVTVG